VVQYGGAVGRVGMRCVYVYVSDVRYVWEMVIRRCVLCVWCVGVWWVWVNALEGGAREGDARDDRSDEDRRGAEPGAQGAHRRAHAHQGETRARRRGARRERMNDSSDCD
jgi:hypothetical protein